MQKPMEVLSRNFQDFKYATVDSLNVPDEFLTGFDLVVFSRVIQRTKETTDRLNKFGIPFCLDLDDYWFLPDDHILKPTYDKFKTPELIIESIKAACFVTCTTEILAGKISEHNDQVYVIENGIDSCDPIWNPKKFFSDRLRFGFTQGTTHIPDVAIVSKDVSRALYDNKFYHHAQIVLCGFYAEPQVESIYIGYERMLTDDLKPLKFHKDYIHELKILHTPDGSDKPYRRVWNKDIDEFGTVYNEFDIAVAPLKDNLFNNCKSNIKMLEAGFMDCGVMVSGVSPYVPLATKENSFLLSERNFFEWQRYILNNPNVLADRKAKLKEDVQKYDLKTLSEKRRQIYEGCICVQ